MQRTAAWVKAGVLASEMESAAIFVLAAIAGARAGSLLQVIGPGDRADAERLDRAVDLGVAAVRQLITSSTD